jgi:tRNA A37 threonylcarbamoyladenosine synthetase subunit TsaC/SUA5/YrdC
VTVATAVRQRLISNPEDCTEAAQRLAEGTVVAHAFANFYAITTRADAETVRRVNALKGRPAGQVGSITGPPSALTGVWDFDRLPNGLSRRTVLNLVDTFFALGPFGFRGPAAAGLPAHLTQFDGDLNTAQVIAPGYACPANQFLSRALAATGDDYLYVTSANRSRHLTGAADSPAHWRAEGLLAEFGDEPNLLVLEHANEAAARARYPRHLPMSTTVLSLHLVVRVPHDPRPHLVLDRHGSLHVDDVRAILAGLGFGLVLGPKAQTRLLLRDYAAEDPPGLG